MQRNLSRTFLVLLALPNMSLISKALGLDAIMGVAITVAIALDLSINVSFNPARSPAPSAQCPATTR